MAMRTLVLGCATGIGNAGARLLAARGDRLALGDIDAPGVESLAAESAPRLRVDATDSAALREFVEAGAEALGGLDYVWSNVGIQIGGSVEQASAEDFDRSFAINVRAHAVVCGAAVPHLRAAGGGAICITASNSALLSEPKIAPYAVTKAAALALARQVARDYSSEGIRVNALCPGWIDTPFNTPAWENFGGRERFLAEVPRLVPLGRIGAPRRRGASRGFLLSDERLVHDRRRASRRRRRVPAGLRSPAPRCYAHDSPIRCRTASLPARQVRPAARSRRRGPAFRGARRARGHARGAPARAHGRLGRTRGGGALTRDEERALGLPWSPELVERGRRSVGATLEAAGAALADGTGANLGGGTHHAFPGVGRGFCLFNDVVAATRGLRDQGKLRRVLVVDLDVHQGDGTHAAFADDSEAFTFALNGLGNYPFRRVPGDLERDLPPGTGDDAYLDALAELLPQAVAPRAPSCASSWRSRTVRGRPPRAAGADTRRSRGSRPAGARRAAARGSPCA